jgi:hypothetical protein
MKKILLFAVVTTLFAACTQEIVVDVTNPTIADNTPENLVVGFEDNETRIQLNNAQKTVWTKGDIVSVFYKSNANQKWKYDGETGARTAQLKRVESGTSTAKTTRVVVVYPYNKDYDFNYETCNICTQLPATQHYLAGSYGENGNIMVSSDEYNQFSLKSVYGWLKLQIKGDGEKVRVITFRGNNGEQVAGEAYIYTEDASMSLAADMIIPGDDNNVGGSLIFDDTIITKLSLDCGTGVTLTEEPTAFYIALPPQIYSKGFTVEIKTTDGKKMIQSTDNEFIINRNHIQPMTALAFVNNGDDGLYIPDEIFKEYLVNNYDDDYDGEISVAEAEYITMVNCSGMGISDITGLEACPNLVTLNCSNNNIKAIELPNLTALRTVTCDGNPIEKLNFDNCLALRYLNLQGVTTNALSDTAISIDNYTQAKTFDISIKNTPYSSFTFTNSKELTDIVFLGEFVDVNLSGNQSLKYIDLTTLENLTTLDVQNCGLLELDVTKNTKLTNLACSNNALTQLNVSKNTALVKLYCSNNKLPRMGLTANTLLEEFDVANNLLSTLNVRNNTALTYLNVDNNADLTMVDVQYNTALKYLSADGLAITDIDLTTNTLLQGVSLANTNLTSVVGLSQTVNGVIYVDKTYYSKGMVVSMYESRAAWGTVNSWCSNYGSGWYLPSLDELKVVYKNKSSINQTLSALGKTILGGDYWSSTLYYVESNRYYYYYLLTFDNGASSNSSTNNYHEGRAVNTFK